MAEEIDKEPEFNLLKIFQDKPMVVITTFFLLGLFLLSLGVGLYIFQGGGEKDNIKIISTEEDQIKIPQKTSVSCPPSVLFLSSAYQKLQILDEKYHLILNPD